MKACRLLSLWVLFLFGVFFVQGCATTAPPPYDYGAYLEHMPTSILVLPPLNESTEVMAPYVYLATVTRPLAERGYYVFPVAVIDLLMKENGVPTPEDMAQVSLDKIREIIDPDAVLYVTIKDWGTKYRVIDSATTIHLLGQLVHTDTGAILWQGERTVVRSSSQNQNSLAEMLVAAVISQIVSSIADPSCDAARMANAQLFYNSYDGLLIGERHSGYETDQREHRRIMNQEIGATANP
jgi:hypothetical protein